MQATTGRAAPGSIRQQIVRPERAARIPRAPPARESQKAISSPGYLLAAPPALSLITSPRLVTSWHKILLPSTEGSLQRSLYILDLAEQANARAGHLPEFAVFAGSEHCEDGVTIEFVLYFSPVAASYCLELLNPIELTACDKPNPNQLGFGLAYGEPEGSRSWDLLD